MAKKKPVVDPAEAAAKAAAKPGRDAKRAAAQAARKAAKLHRVRPAHIPRTPGEARAARRLKHAPMDQYAPLGGGAPLEDPAHMVLQVPDGVVATAAPDGPDIPATPGEQYVAAGTTPDAGYIGLQWVGDDGTGGLILWGGTGAPGRFVVTGIAPAGTVGVRMLLTGHVWPVPGGTPPAAVAVLTSLHTFVVGA